MPIRFSMCNEFCKDWDFARACRLAADCGYEGIEIAPFTIKDTVLEVSKAERRKLAKAARDAGLDVVGLHWLLVKPEGLYVNHPDEQLRRRTTDYLKALIDFCADLKGTRMILGSPKQRNVVEGETYEATWDRTVEVLKELAPHAGERGVCLCLEPLAQTETNFINTAAEARRMVDAVGHPALQMMLDVKAMCGDVEPMPDIIRKSARYVKHFHANDANRLGPGFGDTDYRPIVAALREAKYDGWVSVEVFDFSPGPEKIAGESLRYLKEVFGG